MNSLDQIDYYPFGMLMPERSFSGDLYRFGFNGKESDNELKGNGNSLDFDARIYDSRFGKFLSLDPLARKFPSISPYASFANNPIYFIDPDGRAIKPGNAGALKLLTQMFTTFDTKINGQSATGAELFGIDSKDPNATVIKTSGSLEEFQSLLNNSTLTKDQKNEATAIFKVLASSDVVEIGMVDASTTLTIDGESGKSENTNIFLVTENTQAETLIDASLRGAKSNSDIRGELLNQETSGKVGENEAFGYYDNKAIVTPVGGVKGVILVNADGTYNNSTTISITGDNSRQNIKDIGAMRKSLIEFSKSKEFKRNYTK